MPFRKGLRRGQKYVPESRESIELEKLRAEAAKARADAAWAPKAPRLEMLRTSFTAVTVIVALATFLISQSQQRQQTDRLEREHRQAAVGGLLNDAISAGAPNVRLGALAELEAYTGDPILRASIQRRLLGSILFERDSDVREMLREVLLAHADSALIALLANENRGTRRRLTEHLSGRHLEPGAHLVQAIRDTILTQDSIARQLVQTLEWEAITLTRAINAVHQVRGQDFSNVAFTMHVYDVRKTAKSICTTPGPTMRSGIR